LDARDGGRLVAPVGINGKGAYPFLVDTGATTTVLSQKLAERLGVASRGTYRVHTFAGERSVPVARLETVGIGSHWVAGVDVFCADLGRMFKLEPAIEGILGQDVLARFNYLLDRRGRRLEIEEAGDLGAVLSGTPVPFKSRGGKIYVTVADADAHCAQARAAGAEITRDLFETDYGSREYAAKDPEGNSWYFGTYQPFAYDHEAEKAATAS